MKHPFSADDIPEISSGFRFQWEEAQNSYVLLYPEGMVKLNPSAGEILKRCDGEHSVSQIIHEIKAAFPDADPETDIHSFLGSAYANNWLRHKTA